jgi:hypothetical protein
MKKVAGKDGAMTVGVSENSEALIEFPDPKSYFDSL